MDGQTKRRKVLDKPSSKEGLLRRGLTEKEWQNLKDIVIRVTSEHNLKNVKLSLKA